ncbi:Alkylated DNA repair protein alkB-like protein 7 [Operophtera brumata]|uniref:Alkylated DNA repair protein alkB-like protein 7 n=1 Tax=Operophtera brumata TaxID=104452 RepID=A0A0L7LB09_OPEBR|nr:Alkylated DNA repair protein alkB-like protein 7 [Operophtera brumata]
MLECLSPRDPSFVEIAPTWPADEDPELRAAVLRDMQVLPEFVSEAEEASLMAELEPYLKRMRYEFDHWDNAIQGYRETERAVWNAPNERVLQRVRDAAFRRADTPPLPHTHVLDLAPAGHIKPHVDATRGNVHFRDNFTLNALSCVQFCGALIAGLSLGSCAVMRLQHAEHAHRALDALLARRSLYIMRDVARYSFSHAVLGAEHSAWRGERVPRRRRVALICRSQPDKLT